MDGERGAGDSQETAPLGPASSSPDLFPVGRERTQHTGGAPGRESRGGSDRGDGSAQGGRGIRVSGQEVPGSWRPRPCRRTLGGVSTGKQCPLTASPALTEPSPPGRGRKETGKSAQPEGQRACCLQEPVLVVPFPPGAVLDGLEFPPRGLVQSAPTHEEMEAPSRAECGEQRLGSPGWCGSVVEG